LYHGQLFSAVRQWHTDDRIRLVPSHISSQKEHAETAMTNHPLRKIKRT
jgi:hypothetical protein